MQEAFETGEDVSSTGASKQFVDLTDRQKFVIRDRSISAISRGEDENAVHTELAQKLSAETGKTVTMPQVGATAAWIRIWADQALKAHNLYGTVERDALIRAWDTLSEGEGNSPVVVERIAQELSITGAQLTAVLDRYEEHMGMSRNPTADDEEEEAAVVTANENETEDASTEIRPGEPATIRETDMVNGATFNYDNPEKNAWRDFVLAYLCARVPREERTTKKILCLGGANNLEPKAYIDHGFNPALITSVERDASVQDRFRESAHALGILPVVGELRELQSEKRFDIVSLDYTGPIGKDKIHDIMSILLADDALVVMNCLQKRERAVTRNAAVAGSTYTQHIASCIDKTTDVRLTEIAEAFEERVADIDNQPLTNEEWEAQRKGMMAAAVASFGLQRPENFLHGYPQLESMLFSFDERYLNLSVEFARQLRRALHRKWKVQPPPFLDSAAGSLMNILELYFTRHPLIQEAEFYKYHSEHDDSHSPFLTICAHLRVPEFYSTHRQTLGSFASLMEEMAGDECRGTLAISEQPGKYSFAPPTRILCYRGNGNATASIEMQALIDTACNYKKSEGQHSRLVLFGSADPQENKDPFGPQQAEEMKAFWRKVAAKQQKAAIRKMRPRWGRRR